VTDPPLGRLSSSYADYPWGANTGWRRTSLHPGGDPAWPYPVPSASPPVPRPTKHSPCALHTSPHWCGSVGVLRLQPIQIEAFGNAFYALDLNASWIPTPQRIQAGESWYFQFWFRDPQAGGSGYNFSSALEISFCP